MKHFLLTLLASVSVQASPLTDSVDSVYASTWAATVVNIQTAELARQGRFTQLPWTHKVAPSDGVGRSPDNLTKVVDPNGKNYNSFLDLSGATLRARFCVNVYDGPGGVGYTVALELEEAGETWRRVINHGSDSSKQRDWYKVITPVLPL
jgi:hypothetical protein